MKIALKNITVPVLLGFAFCAAAGLYAQEEGARIYRVEGADFAVTLNGVRTVFPADAAAGGAVRLEQAGIVHTGPGTLLELQLIPSGTVVKLSENTSLVYNGTGGTGKTADLGLLYGRIRVVTGTGGSSPEVAPAGAVSAVIRGGGVSARIENGDLGVDYLLEPVPADGAPHGWISRAGAAGQGPRPLFRVYAFRGSPVLFPYGKGSGPAFSGGVESFTAKQGECLTVGIDSGYTLAGKEPLGRDITGYWALNNFGGTPPMPAPDTSLAAAQGALVDAYAVPDGAGARQDAGSVQERIVYVEVPAPAQPPQRFNYKTKHRILGMGLFLAAAAAGVQAYSYSRFDSGNDTLARTAFTVSYGPLVLGLSGILAGILLDPQPEAR